MPKLMIVTKDGILIESFDLSEWDLDSHIPRYALMIEIEDAKDKALEIERDSDLDKR